MDVSFKKEILQIPHAHDKQELLCSSNALGWTPDQKLIICCAEKIYIVNIKLTPKFKPSSTSVDMFTRTIDQTLTIDDFDDFYLPDDIVSWDSAFLHMEDVDRHQIMSDPQLASEGFLQDEGLRSFKSAKASPFSNQLGRYFILCVTHDCRVFIFTVDGLKTKACECSQWIKKQGLSKWGGDLPMARVNLAEYAALMHSMSTVEIEWSQLFTSGGRSFFVVVTGCRNGDVNFWRLESGFDSREEEFTWLCTDEYSSEVTSIVWQTKTDTPGSVGIGYADGSIRCLVVTIPEEPTLGVSVNLEFADLLADSVSVTELCFGCTDQQTPVLIACKQYFLFMYTITPAGYNFVRHFNLNTTLAITSICLRGHHGVVASLDNIIATIQLQEKDGCIDIVQTKEEMDCLPSYSDVMWMCMGLTISPSCSFCFTAHRCDLNLMSSNKKTPQGKQLIAMSVPFKFSFEELVYKTRDQISTQDSLLSMCLLAKQIIDRWYLGLTDDSELSALTTAITSCADVKGSQIAFGVVNCMQNYVAILTPPKDLPWAAPVFKDLFKRNITKYASSCLEQVYHNMNDIDCRIESSLRQCLENLDKKETEEQSVKQEEGQHCPAICAICASQVSYNGLLTGKCRTGHKIALCCLSLQPCQDFKIRKCGTCLALALSLEALQDSHLIKDKNNCSLCGGFLDFC